VNYPPTAEPMGWASGVVDSPNSNASSRFWLSSDCIPQPDVNVFNSVLLFGFMQTARFCRATLYHVKEQQTLGYRSLL